MRPDLHKPLTATDIRRIKQRHEAGVSMKIIARQFNRCREVIAKVISEKK